MSFSCYPTHPSIQQKENRLAEKLSKLSSYPAARIHAEKFGLAVQSTSWEDTARSKNSCWGPNISDMTLCAEDYNMSMIRKPNYGDTTCDTSIDKFFVTVGNEKKGAELKRIPLKEFLQQISKYTDANVKSMYLERDEKILTSAQACVLPSTQDGSSEFNVRLFNYPSHSEDPAVLVLVVSANGTSCQVVTEYQQKLYFNEAGMATNFVATSLTKHRKDQGIVNKEELAKEMDQSEKEMNALLVFQIPLKQKERLVMRGGGLTFQSAYANECLAPQCAMMCDYEDEDECVAEGNFEDAILSTGKAHSEFKGTRGFTLERDSKYPIRCTIQFYKVSDTLDVPEKEFGKIADKINAVYQKADVYGSLVVDGKTKRVTEANLPDHVIPKVATKMISKDATVGKQLMDF